MQDIRALGVGELAFLSSACALSQSGTAQGLLSAATEVEEAPAITSVFVSHKPTGELGFWLSEIPHVGRTLMTRGQFLH